MKPLELRTESKDGHRLLVERDDDGRVTVTEELHNAAVGVWVECDWVVVRRAEIDELLALLARARDEP